MAISSRVSKITSCPRKKVEIVHPVHTRYQVTGLQVRFGEGFFGIGRGTCWPIVRTSAMDVSVESVEIAQLALLDGFGKR